MPGIDIGDSALAAAEIVALCNRVLAIAGLSARVCTLEDVQLVCSSTSVFVAAVEAVLQRPVSKIFRRPETPQERAHNCDMVVAELSSSVLKADLTHLSGIRVVAGSMEDICNLLELVAAISDLPTGAQHGKSQRQARGKPGQHGLQGFAGKKKHASLDGKVLRSQRSTRRPGRRKLKKGQGKPLPPIVEAVEDELAALEEENERHERQMTDERFSESDSMSSPMRGRRQPDPRHDQRLSLEGGKLDDWWTLEQQLADHAATLPKLRTLPDLDDETQKLADSIASGLQQVKVLADALAPLLSQHVSGTESTSGSPRWSTTTSTRRSSGRSSPVRLTGEPKKLLVTSAKPKKTNKKALKAKPTRVASQAKPDHSPLAARIVIPAGQRSAGLLLTPRARSMGGASPLPSSSRIMAGQSPVPGSGRSMSSARSPQPASASGVSRSSYSGLEQPPSSPESWAGMARAGVRQPTEAAGPRFMPREDFPEDEEWYEETEDPTQQMPTGSQPCAPCNHYRRLHSSHLEPLVQQEAPSQHKRRVSKNVQATARTYRAAWARAAAHLSQTAGGTVTGKSSSHKLRAVPGRAAPKHGKKAGVQHTAEDGDDERHRVHLLAQQLQRLCEEEPERAEMYTQLIHKLFQEHPGVLNELRTHGQHATNVRAEGRARHNMADNIGNPRSQLHTAHDDSAAWDAPYQQHSALQHAERPHAIEQAALPGMSLNANLTAKLQYLANLVLGDPKAAAAKQRVAAKHATQDAARLDILRRSMEKQHAAHARRNAAQTELKQAYSDKRQVHDRKVEQLRLESWLTSWAAAERSRRLSRLSEQEVALRSAFLEALEAEKLRILRDSQERRLRQTSLGDAASSSVRDVEHTYMSLLIEMQDELVRESQSRVAAQRDASMASQEASATAVRYRERELAQLLQRVASAEEAAYHRSAASSRIAPTLLGELRKMVGRG